MTFVIGYFILTERDAEPHRTEFGHGSSGFADGRHKVSPDSEQILLTGTKYRKQNSVSVEQIQDSPPPLRHHKRDIDSS